MKNIPTAIRLSVSAKSVHPTPLKGHSSLRCLFSRAALSGLVHSLAADRAIAAPDSTKHTNERRARVTAKDEPSAKASSRATARVSRYGGSGGGRVLTPARPERRLKLLHSHLVRPYQNAFAKVR